MSEDLKDAIRKWDSAVDAEAAKLIRSGTPPYVAVEEAVRRVTEQRRGASGTKP